jgi:O-antigen/teichoic acid export membrane protein
MRIENSFRNMSVNLLFHVLTMVLAFICRTIFIRMLTTEYLGLNGVFGNVLSLLSLSELGIGSAIIVSLYKPLAERDENRISSLMNFYALSYRIIGVFVFLCGVGLLPFLKYLINTRDTIPNLHLLFLMFVANSSASYFFSYKRTIITADQKEYICTINNCIFLTVQNILQILVLLLTGKYIAYLSAALLCTLLSNIFISIKANSMYPFLKTNKSRLTRPEIKGFLKKVAAMMSHKFGSIVIGSTDTLLISSMIGTVWAGLYSNYLMLINIIVCFVNIVFSSVSASVGNFNATEGRERVFFLFKVMMQLSCWIYGFCSICFIVLFRPFIVLWIGEEYLLYDFTVMVIIVNFYMAGIMKLTKSFNMVSGLYFKTRFIPWIYASVNIAVSIMLLRICGIAGVFLGTLSGCLVAEFWYEPYVLYRDRFLKPPVLYFLLYAKYAVMLAAAGFFTYYTSALLPYFVYKAVVCVIVPNMCFYALNMRTKEFFYLKSICTKGLKQRKLK